MRKRSASESGRRNTSPVREEVTPIPGKLRKVRHNSSRGDDSTLGKKKSPHGVETPNSTNRRKTQLNTDDTINNRYINHTSNSTTSGEDNLLRRRSTVSTNLEIDISKQKQEPLPDIMHDWEIIVKSLRETHNQTEEANNTKPPKSTGIKLSVSKNLKQEFTDSDKENSSLKKKVENFHGRGNDVTAPSTSATSISKPKLNGDKDSKPSKLGESSSPDDSEAMWRRPTRSTYKAFEHVFESPELVETLPLVDESELNGDYKKEVDALKVLLTPKKLLNDHEAPSVTTKQDVRKIQKASPINSKDKKTTLFRKANYKTIVKRKRGRPPKELNKELERKIKGQRITRGMEKERVILLSEDELVENDEKTKKDKIEQSFTEILSSGKDNHNSSQEEFEMDFIGFGSSPPAIQNENFKSPAEISYKKEVIEEESLMEETTPPRESENEKDEELYGNKEGSEGFDKVSFNEGDTYKGESETEEDTVTVNCSEILNAITEFEEYFGISDDSCHEFEGFPSKISENHITCLSCRLVLGSCKALKEHVKIGHKRVYTCPFDLGQCGQLRGAINLQRHLERDHRSLLLYLEANLTTDDQNGKIAHWPEEVGGCGVCLMSLEQPLRAIHEILIHGVWPPSLLSLSSVAVDQHVSLWWTGRSLAFACHLCHLSQAGTRNQTIPIVTSSPHCFPTLLSNHLRNVHLLNLPLIQGWWLMMRLLLSLPASPRRTLSTVISLGVDTSTSYSSCLICSTPLSFYCNINLKNSYGLCSRCEILCRSELQCWFNCKNLNFTKPSLVFSHLVSNHKSKVHGAWCILCGAWAPSILIHLAKCKDSKSSTCKFCTFKIEGLSLVKKAWHSLNHHTYPCPIPNCLMPLYSHGQPGSHRRLPTARTLLNHLIGQHMPEWSGFVLDQISTLIFNTRKTQGVVLTIFSSQQLSSKWISLSGHKYSLNKGVLSPVETVKVPMICLLCLHHWEENLAYTSKEEGALCSECTLWLSQCGGGDPTPQCPVFRCLEKISSFTELYQHLTLVHKLIPLSNRSTCSYCGSVSLGSPLASITHNLLQHNIACLLCPFTAPTIAQVHAHRVTMHGLPNWDAVFQHLKMEEYARNKEKGKPTLLSGVVKVWMGEKGTEAQWDPPLNLSELLVSEESEEHAGIIGQSYFIPGQTPLQDSNEFDPWCSSLCTVSLSPCKFSSENTIDNKDIKSEPLQLPLENESPADNQNHADEDTDNMENLSPELLVPSVTVAEDSEDNTSNSDNHNLMDKETKLKNRELSDSTNDKESDCEAWLEMDTSEQSSCLGNHKNKNCKTDNCLTVKIPVSIPSSPKIKKTKTDKSKSPKTLNKLSNQELAEPPMKTKIPTFELVDTLNSVMAETLQSMSQVLSDSVGAPEIEEEKKKLVPPLTVKTRNKKNEPRGLGDNAFVDVKTMGENILKDLEDKYSGTCIRCGNSIQLMHLSVHIKTIHPGRVVQCSCGFKGDLYTTLVHSFHMSHIPSEARPIVLTSMESEKDNIMIVLEARPDVKTMNYPCFKCSKKFKQEKSRQLHYNLCKLEKKFSCTLCGEKFALENHLVKHKEWKHNPQTCPHCNKEFNSSSSLTQHVLYIHKKTIAQRCKHCGDYFNNLKQLKVHLRVHSGEQPHKCQNCALAFISRNLLHKHLLIEHKIMAGDNIKTKSKDQKNELLSDSDSSDSDSGETSKDKEKKYEARMKNVPFTESDLDTSSSDLDTPQPLHPKKTKIPSVRKTSVKEQNTLQKELEVKKKAGIYQDRELVTLPPLREEIKDKVEASVGRVCNPCEQEFDSAAGKLLHMYLIHPGVVLTHGFHDCCFCNHKFLSADDVSNHHLDKHQRTALQNGNFRCLCGLVFREDGAYYFHLYYAHKAQRALNIGGEIVCRLCDGRVRLNKIVDLVVHLSDRHTMFDHVRFNDYYMCNFCYKAFESWTVLSLHFFMVHKATKSQTLSYDCPYCQGASPWHSLEALQYHLDNVHRGRHTHSRPVPEHSRSIYTPAPVPSSPTKRKELPATSQADQPSKKVPKVKKPNLQKSKISNSKAETLYCICQCPYDEVSDMIGCDNPNCKFQWFHFECVGIMSAPEGNWFCPDCSSFAQQKQKQAQKQRQLQADLYEYYSNYSNDATEAAGPTTTQQSSTSNLNRTRQHSSSSGSSSSNSSNTSSSSSSSTSSSSSESSSGSGEEN